MGKRTDWTERGERSRTRRAGRSFLVWLLLAAVVLTAVVLVKFHGAEPFSITSPSMEPSLRPGDRVVVDKVRYRLGDPRRGDVVVFDKPAPAGGSAEAKKLVQRVIAVPGDEIEARDGIVYLNGKVLDESYLRRGTVTTDIARQRILEDRFWVMGDSREMSEDSRLFGPIPESLILGRAIVRIWPATDIGWIRVD
ncbi:MAG: signal peptidase [Actinomycetota bacterium]|jgi:signal peptidase I|nr:signal peptidase [Actinomycetota bacterium]